MAIVKIPDKKEEPRRCLFMGMECNKLCPGWIAAVDDCLFTVCLTQVKETFVIAAQYFDEHFGLEDGTGIQTLQNLRAELIGDGGDGDKAIVQNVLSGLVNTGVLDRIQAMSLVDMGRLISGVEEFMSFTLGDLFSGSDNDC